MYMISVYAACVGLILLIGAALFAGCAALLIVKDGCLILVDMTGRILVRVCFSAARALPRHPLSHLEGSDGRGLAGVVVSHGAVSARSLVRMR